MAIMILLIAIGKWERIKFYRWTLDGVWRWSWFFTMFLSCQGSKSARYTAIYWQNYVLNECLHWWVFNLFVDQANKIHIHGYI